MAVLRLARVRQKVIAALRGFAIEYGSVNLGVRRSRGCNPPVAVGEAIAYPALMTSTETKAGTELSRLDACIQILLQVRRGGNLLMRRNRTLTHQKRGMDA